MKKNKILYVIIGVLAGVIIILGAILAANTNRLRTMEKTVGTLEDSVKDTLAQVKDGTLEAASVEDEYVAVNGDEENSSQEEKEEAPEETATPTPTESLVDASTEFDDLEPQMEELISASQQSAGGKWAIYVEDLTTGGNMSLHNEKMQAASLIKLYIMGAIYERYDELGNESVDSLLHSMITVSDNDAANSLVEILGGGDSGAGMQAVNAFCVQYNFNDTQMGRLLLAENPTGENYTSVEDCGKFLYRVYTDKFDHSEDMENLLKAQTKTAKIPAGVPDGIEVGNKTGELDNVENDVAIVYGDTTPYVVCIMTQDLTSASSAVEHIGTLSQAVYGYTNQT